MISPVDFIDQIERAYTAGVRTFVEVGPRKILSRLIDEILANRPHQCLPLDQARRNEMGPPAQETLDTIDIALKQEIRQPHAPDWRKPSESTSRAVSAAKPTPKAHREGSTGEPGSSPKLGSPEESALDIIEEISGYPRSMIQPDLDLEADLGIDTLKIFEISARLKALYPALAKQKIDLGKLRNLRGIAGLIREAGARTLVSASHETDLMPGDTTSGQNPLFTGKQHSLRRWVLEALRRVLLPEDFSENRDFSGMHVIVRASDNPAFDQAMLSSLTKSGCQAVIWTPNPSDMETLVNGGTLDVFAKADYYFHPIPKIRFGRKTRKTFFRNEIFSLFLLGRQYGKRLRKIVVITDLGGDLAVAPRDPSGAGFLSGVIPAFCQALEKDFPGLQARGIDLPAFSPEQSARIISLGLARGLPAFVGLLPGQEISYHQTSPKAADILESALQTDPISELKKVIHSQTVILVTGGGSGITAYLTSKLAREFSPHLILIGRAPERPELVKDLRLAGSETWYLSCDLADGPMVDRTTELIKRRYPKIDVLIHGAGIEISRNLARKTPEEIEKVYRVKVAGLVNLIDALGEENVGTVVSFSSIASLFGNPGHVDYSAANGFLNQFTGRGKARFLTIAWSAWDRIGMASRGPIHELLKSYDVEFIPPEKGMAFFLAELRQFLCRETCQHQTVGFFGRLGGGLQPSFKSFPSDRFVIDPMHDTYLQDHTVGGRCLVPAVATLSRLVPCLMGKTLPPWIAFDQLQFLLPIKLAAKERAEMVLYKTGMDLELWTPPQRERVASASGTRSIEGRVSEHGRCHLTCQMAFTPPPNELRRQWQEDAVRLKLLLDREFGDQPLEREFIPAHRIYNILFHGPSFQVLQGIERWDAQVLSAIPTQPPANFAPGQGHWPFYLEASLHAAGVMGLIRVATSKNLLPSFVGHLSIIPELLEKPGEKRILVEFLDQKIEQSHNLSLLFMRFNVVLIGSEGPPQLVLRNLTMVNSQDDPRDKLVFFTLGAPHRIQNHSCFAVKLSDADQLLNHQEHLELFLAPEEQKFLATLTHPKRRREWLGGRMALKFLVRHHVLTTHHTQISPASMSVESKGKAPHLQGSETLDPAIRVTIEHLSCSITHSGDLAMAVIGDKAIGIDLEMRHPLDAGTRNRFLSSEENRLLGPNEEIALWTAKEAVAKVLGLGFQINDFLNIQIAEFGFNERYRATYKPDGTQFTCITFKDQTRVATLAWKDE